MTDRIEDLFANCPECENIIRIHKRWTAGGINDYGSWKVQCSDCNNVFTIPVGRDVNDSQMGYGATLLEVIVDR